MEETHLNETLNEIREEIQEILSSESRLTVEEVAGRLERGEGVVRTVMESMYARNEIEPLYVYQIRGE